MIIKKDFGSIRGAVNKLIALPTINSPKDPSEFAQVASKVLTRRTDLSWDNFDQFVTDAKSVAIVEVLSVSESEIYAACSCEIGIKGKACVHNLAVYIMHGMVKKPSKIPMIGRFSRKRGKIPVSKKQLRF